MSAFNNLYDSVTEKIKFHDIPQTGSDAKTAGFGPDVKDGWGPENVDSLSISTDLEERIRDVVLSSNMYEPSITEDQEVINSAIQDFIRRIKKTNE